MPTRIVVADDHAMFREMLRIALSREEDLEVVGEAGDGVEVVHVVGRLRPDVLLLDYKMPCVRSFADLVAEIRACTPPTALIVLSAFANAELAIKAAAGGARGYVLKATRLGAVAEAVRGVAAGGIWIDPGLPPRVFDVFQRAACASSGRHDGLQRLTRREREVLALVAQGSSNPDIARHLCVSQPTIKTHVTRIFAKLRVSNRLAATLAYYGRAARSADAP